MKKLTAWMGAVACATLVGCGGGGGSSFDYRTLTAAELQRAFFNSYFATSTVPPLSFTASGQAGHCEGVQTASMNVDATQLAAQGVTQLTFGFPNVTGQDNRAHCMAALFPQWAPQGGSATGTMQYDFVVSGGVIQSFLESVGDASTVTGTDLKGNRTQNYFMVWANPSVAPVGQTTITVKDQTSTGNLVGNQTVSYTLSSSGVLVVKTESSWQASQRSGPTDGYPTTFTQEDTYQVSGSAGNYSVTLKKITATGTDTGISPVTSTITLTTP